MSKQVNEKSKVFSTNGAKTPNKVISPTNYVRLLPYICPTCISYPEMSILTVCIATLSFINVLFITASFFHLNLKSLKTVSAFRPFSTNQSLLTGN